MSVFLEMPKGAWVASCELAFAIRDGFPVTEGHTLVIPKRVVATWFEATREEQRAILDLVWRYCGVGRLMEEDGTWSIPEVDFATWRALGSGREASRRLPLGTAERALAVVESVLSSVGEGEWLEADGKRCRVVGRAARGGLRVDGGDEGFAERTLSLLDIAWVLASADDVNQRGGLLDEARVNRLRYLDGTPKGSTRWIDCGWAIVAVKCVVRSRPISEPG